MLRSESPDLDMWEGWTKSLERKGGEAIYALAVHFGNSRTGGVVLLKDFRGVPMHWQYPEYWDEGGKNGLANPGGLRHDTTSFKESFHGHAPPPVHS